MIEKKTVRYGSFKICSFVALVFVLAWSSGAMIDQGLRNIKTSKFGSFNKLVSGQINTDILISGSSRALCHYDPRLIQTIAGKSAYNIGVNASQIDLQLSVLKTYLAHNIKPGILIQNLDLFSFETTRKDEIYDPGFYMPFLGEGELYEFLETVHADAPKWKNIPLYGYTVPDMRFTWIAGVLGYFGIFGKEDHLDGFNPRQAVWSQDFALFQSNNPRGIKYSIKPSAVRALEEIIQISKNAGIKLILVYSPEYFEMHVLEVNRSEIFKQIQDISAVHGLLFWDYSSSELSRQQRFFNNSQHLNANGASAFSTDLAYRIAGERRGE